VAGTYELVNGPAGSIKFGELLAWLKICFLLKKDSAARSKAVNKSAHTLLSALGACCAIQHFPAFNNRRLQFISAWCAVVGPSGRAV